MSQDNGSAIDKEPDDAMSGLDDIIGEDEGDDLVLDEEIVFSEPDMQDTIDRGGSVEKATATAVAAAPPESKKRKKSSPKKPLPKAEPAVSMNPTDGEMTVRARSVRIITDTLVVEPKNISIIS